MFFQVSDEFIEQVIINNSVTSNNTTSFSECNKLNEIISCGRSLSNFGLATVGANQFDRQFPESPSELGCAGTSTFRPANPEYLMLVAVKCDRFTMFINVLPGSHHVVERVF